MDDPQAILKTSQDLGGRSFMESERNLERNIEERSSEMFAILEDIPGRTYFSIAIGSIVMSAFLFLIGRRNWALFVGQWPPTLVAMALFFRLLHPSQEHGTFTGVRQAAEDTRRTMGQ
jgi:hypothetical protein